MKFLPKQLLNNQNRVKEEHCFIATNDDGEYEMDQGYCELTGKWTNSRVELRFEDGSNVLACSSLAYALTNCDDYESELEKALA